MFFIELADKLYNSVIVCFCALRSQVGTKCGLGALPHSLWLDVCSNRLAIWMKALWFLCKSINFHPDKQLLQVASAGDWTTDLWIPSPELYPYTTGDSPLAMIITCCANEGCCWSGNAADTLSSQSSAFLGSNSAKTSLRTFQFSSLGMLWIKYKPPRILSWSCNRKRFAKIRSFKLRPFDFLWHKTASYACH